MLEKNCHVTPVLISPSHCVLICFLNHLLFFVMVFRLHDTSCTPSLSAAAATCHMITCAILIMTVQLFCLYFQLFLLAVDFLFIFIFFYLIFLCSSPDCMLVSQATFQSKHYSFFCSSNIFVPTSSSAPTSCLVSCSVEMSKPPPPFAMLHPEPSLFLSTLQPSAPTTIADGHFLTQKKPLITALTSSLLLSFPFLSW